MIPLILQALCNQYDLLKELKGDEIPTRGYSYAKVSYALVLNKDGDLKDIFDLREEDKKKKLRPVNWLVPEQKKRSGKNPPAYFLCDNAKYVLGYSRTKKKEKIIEAFTEERFKLFYDCHRQILNADHPLMQYLNKWQPSQTAHHPVVMRHMETLDFTGNFVFYIEEHAQYLHKDEGLVEHYLNVTQQNQEEHIVMDCLVTGKPAPIARIHTAIKGVVGAQPAGANIIGFNDDAFCSYGKSQSYNAPVGEEAMFKYTTALNYMLANPNYHYTLKEQTFVFWSNAQKEVKDIFGYSIFSRPENESDTEEDHALRERVQSLLIKAKKGIRVACQTYDIPPDTALYILGLTPNNARLSISFWQVNSLAYFVERLVIHYADLELVGIKDKTSLPLRRIIGETIPKTSKDKKISPRIEKGLLEAILTKDKLYPVSLYLALLNRIKADQNINSTRTAMIKAYRNRKDRITKKGEGLPMALDKESKSTAYQLGRLFALLEIIQREAIKGIKKTIKESYFATALTNPVTVFQRLLRLSNFHTVKLKNRVRREKEKADILANIAHFPKRLTLDEQGDFVLGYYHQNYELYKTKEEREKEEKKEKEKENNHE